MDKLNNILNIEPTDVVVHTPIARPVNKQAETDFDYARENLMDVIEKGQEALFDMMDVAKQSQHPRAYEVLSTLIGTLVGANKDLLDLQFKKKKLMEADPSANARQVTNNLFVGSTMELQKMLDQRKNKNENE